MDEGLSSLRVLLVEDDQHDRLAFRRALRGGQVAGEITECLRAENALELVRADASSFDVVVVDHGLPGLSGMELCKQLLEEQIPLPLVILTGAGSEQLAVEALRAGVDDYLVKDPNRAYLDLLPVVLPNVVRRHRDRLERKQAEENLRRSESELSAIYENAPLVMMLVDRERRVVKINPQALSMARRSVEEIIGLPGGEVLRCVHLSGDPKGCGFGPACEACGVRNTVLRTFQSGKAIHRREASIPYDHPDGRVEMHLLVSTTPLSVSEEDLVLVCLEDVTDRKNMEKEREKLVRGMGERVKELGCVYGLAKSICDRKTMEDVFRDVVALIPSGWRYPEITRGKVRFEGREFVVEPFEETEWKQTSDLVVDGEVCGSIEVYYLEPRRELDEGPFMKEERHLIDAMAQALSQAIERRQAEEALQKAHQQLELRVKERTLQLSLTNEMLRREIADRTRMEESLRESEKNLSLIYDTVSDVLFQVKVESEGGFRFSSVNQAFLDATGLTEKQVVGKRMEDVIPQPSRAFVRGRYEEAIREKTTVTWEETSLYPSGVKIGFATVTPALNEDGICTHLIGSVHDITERKRAEEALRHSEEKYRSIFEVAADLIICVDQEGIIVDCNNRIEPVLGYAQDEITKQPMRKLLHPHYFTKAQECLKEALTKGSSYNKELKFVRKDGAVIDVCVDSARLPGTAGEHARSICIVTDITQRKQADEALRASEARYRSLFENMLEGYAYCKIILDDNDQPVDFVYLEVNDSFEKLTGLEKDKTIGARVTELIPGITESQPNLFEIYGKVALTGESTRFDLYFQPLQIWLSISVYCPQREYFVVVFDNITERKLAEEALRASEDRAQRQLDELNHLYNTAPVGLCLFDRDLRFLRINERLAAINGRSVEEHIGQTLAEVLPELAGEITRVLQQVIETGQPVLNTEFSGPTPAEPDVVRHWLVNHYPVKAENGQVRAIGSVVQDITERKQAEERLRGMEAQLAHVARVSTLGEMVAGIAHEVNQPLCSIRNFTQASGNLLAAEKPVNLDDLREWNAAINRAAAHAVEVVKRLRGFARRTESQRSFCEINEIVNEALHLVAFEAGRHETTVRLELSEVSPIVHVDRVEIQQVLVNLLQNAYEAMDESETEVREVTVRTEPSGESVEISVADAGPGLPSEGDLQIFSPFFTTKQDGLGMGLAIATTIVEAHGGKLRAASNRDGGATFHFTLPLAGEGVR